MSVGSNIYPEFGITALTTKYISRDLFPFVGGTASTQCFLGASFSGKKAPVGYSAIRASAAAGFGIAVDSSGNVYTTGNYNSLFSVPVPINTFGTVSTASGLSLPVATSANDMYVIKWNALGTLTAYTHMGGNGNDSGYEIAADSTGNVYVTGFYQSTLTVPLRTFGTAPSSTGVSMPASTSTSDAFVIRWNPNGTLGGYSNLKGSGADTGNSIAFDSTGNIYITGQYTATAIVPINTFGTAPVASGVNLPISTVADMFVIRWNPNGTLGGYSNLKGTGADSGQGIAVDSTGNVYVAGFYTSTGIVPINTLGTAPAASGVNLPISGVSNVFVIRWNPNGTLGGYSTFGGTGNNQGNGIAVDSARNIYVTGYYQSTGLVPINTFGTAPAATGVSMPATNASTNDAFVIKWNANGTLAGYSTIRGINSDAGNRIAVDSARNIYITGQYSSNTATIPINTFGTAPVASGVSLPISNVNGLSDAFVIKWNANGTVGGYSTVKGNRSNFDVGNCIAVDSGGNFIYATGSYISTVPVPLNTFGTAPAATGVSLPSTVNSTLSDSYVIKWQP